MAPKKSKAAKAALKKAGTMAATAAAGQEFLKQAWGEDKLNKVNALLEARDKSDTNADEETSSASSTTGGDATASSSASAKTKGKPKLSKARTMKSTAKEAKALLGKQVLGDTRAETKRRQAAVKAKKALQEVTKPAAATRKPALKRLGTMANTAREGKAYVKRTTASKKKGKTATGRKRTGGRPKK
jgi:hypothetical protein